MRNLSAIKLSLMLITLVVSINLSGQTMLPFYPNLPDAVHNQSYTLQFSVEGLPPGVNITRWDWSSNVDFDGPPAINLTLNDLGQVSGTVNSAWGTCSPCRVTVTAERSDGAADIEFTYNMVVRSPPAGTCPDVHEFFLVLDASGSMNTTTPRGNTRWEELKSAVITYFPLLKAQVNNTDRLHVIFFQRGSGDVFELFDGTFNDIDEGDPSEIDKEIFGDGASTVSPGGATPLGQGVLDAFTGFADADNSNNIIVFTDGYQNQDPMFIEAAQTISGTSITGDIKVFSIGVGGSDESMLRVLSNPDDVFAHAYDSDEMNLFFTNTIPFSFRDCTPRIVDYRYGNLIGENDFNSEVFKVDSLVENLTIRVLTTSQHSALNDNYQLLKDGIPVAVSDYYDGTQLRYEIEFPKFNEDSTWLDGGGEWELRFSGTRDAEYEFTAIVDDEILDSRVTIANNQRLYPGNSIPVRLDLSIFGEPVEGATVTALLVRPGEDMRDLVARTNFPANQLNPSESTPPPGLNQSFLLAQAKIDTLLGDTNFLAQLAPQSRTITLNYNAASGAYEGVFPGKETEQSGTYKVVVDFEGSTDGLGVYEGMETKWLYLDFGTNETIKPAFRIIRIGSGDLVNYQVVLKPRNQFNKLLGPGQAHRINVSIGGQIVMLTDQLDGSYTGNFSTQPGENPTVTVNIIDQETPIIKKPLYSFLSTFGLSVHAGSLRSLDDAAPLTTSSTGTYIEVDLSYKFSPKWGLELVGGRYNYSSPDLSFIGGHLLAEYGFLNPSGNGLFLNGALGLGALKPDNQDLELSIGAKALVGYRVGSNLEAGLDLGAYWLPTPGYRLGLVGGSLRYFF
jgi:hypothetical protein